MSENDNIVNNLLRQMSENQTETRHPLPRKPINTFLTVIDTSTNSLPPTPAVESFDAAVPKIRPASTNAKENHAPANELFNLQQQLVMAQNKISELQGMPYVGDPKGEFVRGSPFDAKYVEGPLRHPGSAIIPPGGATGLNSSWSVYDDSRSDTNDALSASGFNRARHIWNAPKLNQHSSMGYSDNQVPSNTNPWNHRGGNTSYVEPGVPFNSAPGSDPYRNPERISPDYDMTIRCPNSRRPARFDRFGFPAFGNQGPYGGGSNFSRFGQSPCDNAPAQNNQYALSAGTYSSHHPSAIGTPLSPLATEFTSGNGPWKTEVSKKWQSWE